MSAVLPEPSTSAEEASRAATEVLSRPEYAEAGPGLVDRAVSWFLRELAERLGPVGPEVDTPWVAVAVVAVVALLVVLALLVRRFARRLRADPVLADTGPVGRPPLDWAAEAARHEQAGRWRDAVRCRYRELVAALAAAGVVEEVPGRTAGEYLRALGERCPEAAEDFAAVTARFERAWYGRHEPTPDEVDAVRADAERVRATCGAGGHGRARAGAAVGGQAGA